MQKQFFYLIGIAAFLYGCGKTTKEQQQTTQEERKKVFRYNQAEGLTSLDPAHARTQANIWAVTQLYNGLFEFTESLVEQVCLAESYDVSSDGKTYIIKIRKGVHFHDSDVFPDGKGREVTAEDFVYSFKRILDPNTASSGAWIFNDKVLRDKNGNISDTCFKALDKYTLAIYLQKQFPPFLQILAMPYCFVVPREAVEKYGKDFGRNPVGTGPFKFQAWDDGNSLTFLKNPNYWRRDINHNPLPYLDAVQISFIADKNTEFLTFQQGKLDLITGIDASIIDQILKKDGTPREEIAQKFTVQKVDYLNTEYLGFILDPSRYEDKNHPLLDKRVRQALSYAINREELVSYIRNNLGVPGDNGFVPPFLPSFDENKVKGYNFNPDKANALLKEAGYGQGGKKMPELVLYTTPTYKEISEYLQKQWSSVLGIPVRLEINTFATHLDLVNNGKAMFFRASWLGDYPDEENFLSCFYSKNFAPAGPNKTRFKNATFDKLYEDVQKISGFERHDIYHKLDQIVMNESAVIVLYYDEVLRLTQKYVQGLETNAMNVLKLEKVDFTN
ncbi:MAG: ABC transporter substrate-binding protein [Cytophagales bacterium]|nr:ABC transporter substrate-binding protein [Cytophagales bacterium]MDW8385128.1 ABC transporter substrate-binding protein [Flammeovirgaceae bacterium]